MIQSKVLMLNFKGTSVDQPSSRCTGCMKVKISFKKNKSIYFLSTFNKNQKLLDTNFVILSIHMFPWGHVRSHTKFGHNRVQTFMGHKRTDMQSISV